MVVTRRIVLAGLPAALAACSAGLDGLADNRPQRRDGAGAPAPRPVANPEFDAWLEGFRPRAMAAGVSQGAVARGLAGAGYLPAVVSTAGAQTEFRRSMEDNIALAASDARICTGKAKLSRYRRLFDRIEARYGVEREVVCALWGHESIYGERRGNVPVVSALASLAFAGRRPRFNEAQLIAALKIVQAGEVGAGAMRGSWAGAMGHLQFIPTTYLASAVDFDGDGRRDIWGADPTDALASAASYLKAAGWRQGQPWGVEIDPASGRALDGRDLSGFGAGEVLHLAGATGPAFRMFHNYKVLLRFNNARSYAVAVGHLADRLAGKGPIRGQFPPDAEGLVLAERKEIQRRLTALGYDTGTIDGVIGPESIGAIRAFQAATAIAMDGRASRALLASLRGLG